MEPMTRPMARGSLGTPAVRRQEGFSLTELMVVVAILGILSAVAVMSFQRYAVRIRVGEAYSMLGLIKAREEVYRAEFGRYCSAAWHPGGVGAPNPAPANTRDWALPAPAADWQQIGVRADRGVYFVYQVAAGTPSVAPAPVGWDGGAPPGYPLTDFYFVATARSDIDGDGALSRFELCSVCRAVWVDPGEDFEGQ